MARSIQFKFHAQKAHPDLLLEFIPLNLLVLKVGSFIYGNLFIGNPVIVERNSSIDRNSDRVQSTTSVYRS